MTGAANDAPAAEQGKETMEASCGNCPFASPTRDPGMMLCHRYPPQVIVMTRQISTRDQLQGASGVEGGAVPQTVWPIVPIGEICGEHPLLSLSVSEEVARLGRELAADRRRGGKNGRPHHNRRR